MKQKFYLWFNIVFICLCMCAIGVGIYSLSANSINSSGKVAFFAHDVSVTVTGTIVGHATGNATDGAPVTEPESLNPAIFENGIGSMDLGNRYFSNCPESGDLAEDIIINLSVTNTSNCKITATMITSTSPEGINISSDDTLEDLEIGDDWNVTITLKIVPNSEGYFSIEQQLNNVNLGFSFSNYKSPFYISNYANQDWLTTDLTPTHRYLTLYGNALDPNGDWIAFAVKDENLSGNPDQYYIDVTEGSSAGRWYSLRGNIDWDNIDITGKTFWFISRFSLSGYVRYRESDDKYLRFPLNHGGDDLKVYHENNLHQYLQNDFYIDNGFCINKTFDNSSAYPHYGRAQKRTVVDPARSIDGVNFDATSFESNFWLPSVEEFFLLNGGSFDSVNIAAIDFSGTRLETSGLGEPIDTKGRNGYDIAYSNYCTTRSSSTNTITVLSVVSHNGWADVSSVGNNITSNAAILRPACEITV